MSRDALAVGPGVKSETDMTPDRSPTPPAAETAMLTSSARSTAQQQQSGTRLVLAEDEKRDLRDRQKAACEKIRLAAL